MKREGSFNRYKCLPYHLTDIVYIALPVGVYIRYKCYTLLLHIHFIFDDGSCLSLWYLTS